MAFSANNVDVIGVMRVRNFTHNYNNTNPEQHTEGVHILNHKFRYVNNRYGLMIPWSGDKFNIRGVLIKNAYVNSSLNNDQPLKIKTFIFNVGSQVIQRVDVQMLNNIDAIEEIDTYNRDYVYYNFEKSNILSNEIDIIRLPFSSVEIHIEFMNDNMVSMDDIDCECYLQYKYLSNIPRRNLAESEGFTLINNIETKVADNLTTYTGGTVYLNTSKFFNGIYINGIDYKTIRSLRVNYCLINSTNTQNIEICSYSNQFELTHFSTIVNSNTIYIPFNNNVPNDINFNSYTLNRNCLLSVTIYTSNTEPSNVKYSIITQDKLTYLSGMGGIIGENNYLTISTDRESLIQPTVDVDVDKSPGDNWKRGYYRLIGNLIEGEDTMCSVTIETIERNDNYIHCIMCNKNFKEISIEWITKSNNCPHCRQPWGRNNYIVYNNSAE